MKGLPTNKLSIYLIKDSYSNHKSILKNFNKLMKEEIKDGIGTMGTLYYGDSHLFEPSWIRNFFGSSFENNKEQKVQYESGKLKLFNASSKAVLLIEHQNRIFAISFGYGRNLLNHGVWEERFGLKTTLNMVDANNLRRIDKKNMSSIPKDTSEQLSREGIATDFGIDIEQDLIQSITGKSKKEVFGRSITGKDALSVSVKVNLFGIKEFLEICYQKYLSDDYKKDFGWIDQIAEVKDPNLTEKLNGKLIENIKNDEVDRTWMAVPELVDWADVLGFSYKNSTRDTSRQDDIHLPDFLDSLSDDDKNYLSVEILKRKKIFCFDAQNEQIKHQWSAYNCLYCETNDDINEKTYLLSNGKWYEVEKDFSRQVDADYRELRSQISTFTLPSYQHENEKDYNEKIAKNDNQFCCMDRKNISYGGGYSKIEFCDLLTKDKKIIHVKHYGGSSVLSHLFLQGVVSSELFIADKDFRQKVNEKLSDSHKIDNVANRPRASDYEVIFAIISSSDKDLEIPFFSKVSLRNAKRRLETYGYKVALQKIKAER